MKYIDSVLLLIGETCPSYESIDSPTHPGRLVEYQINNDMHLSLEDIRVVLGVLTDKVNPSHLLMMNEKIMDRGITDPILIIFLRLVIITYLIGEVKWNKSMSKESNELYLLLLDMNLGIYDKYEDVGMVAIISIITSVTEVYLSDPTYLTFRRCIMKMMNEGRL